VAKKKNGGGEKKKGWCGLLAVAVGQPPQPTIHTKKTGEEERGKKKRVYVYSLYLTSRDN